RPLPEAELPVAPDAARFPDRGHGPPFRLWNEVPRVPRLRHLLGPSVIALGMGLGVGELLLWPNLVVVNGFSIWWLFWVGVVTQFVVLVEIERWTLATGESVFGGMGRLDRRGLWPWFFALIGLLGMAWPGWASQSAEFAGAIVAAVTGTPVAWQPIALAMIAGIWLALAASRVVYNALERFELLLVATFFPLLLLVLVVVGVAPEHVLALGRGAVSLGAAPEALLTGAQFPTLLLAVAYAGSGGTLLLAQSLWIRDKGFGMAAYQGRIAGLRGANEQVSETGYVFDPEAPGALARFRLWLRLSRQELLWLFVVLIILSVVVTTLVAATTLGTGDAALAGRMSEMVQREAAVLRDSGGRGLALAFLLGGSLVLFSTQLGIMDTITRIAGTVFYERFGRRTRFWTLKRTFLLFLSGFSLASMAVVWVSWRGGAGLEQLQPDFLVLVAGPFTIAAMYLFTLVVGTMNVRRLPAALAPGPWQRAGLAWAATLWGWFTAEQVTRVILQQAGAPALVASTVTWHPVRGACYLLWIGSLAWFVGRLVRGRRPPESAAAARS
ncbi:MAG TPA: Nramp family divalent metal transporter, partial [Gemmatimonadales bacterium]|nr:Nramp family divalent metal transporter [Gemmatimonadales bacterium]